MLIENLRWDIFSYQICRNGNMLTIWNNLENIYSSWFENFGTEMFIFNHKFLLIFSFMFFIYLFIERKGYIEIHLDKLIVLVLRVFIAVSSMRWLMRW